MQAIPAMAVMQNNSANSANSANAAQAAGVENDSVSVEGVDFSSMLKAQIKAGRGLDAEIKARLDAVSVELAPVEVGAQQEMDFLSGSAFAPDSSLIPLVGAFMPNPVVIEMQFVPPGMTAATPGKAGEGIKGKPVVLDQFGTELPPIVQAGSSKASRLAEFAVDGEMLPQSRVEGSGDLLPQGRVERGGELLRQPLLSAELPRILDIPANAMPAMTATNQPALVETKPIQFSPLTLQAPLGSSDWNDAFGQKVVWIAGQQTQVAELRLNPPHLGPMEVRLSVSNDQISAIFVSHQPAVREAIESALPRLREMFADGGLTLGNATVNSDSLPQQQMPGREGQSGSSRQSDIAAFGDTHLPQKSGGVISLRQDGSGMVDLFA